MKKIHEPENWKILTKQRLKITRDQEGVFKCWKIEWSYHIDEIWTPTSIGFYVVLWQFYVVEDVTFTA